MKDIEEVIEAAASHGEATDLDHEVGDLQDILRAAWEILDLAQRRTLLARHEVAQLKEWL